MAKELWVLNGRSPVIWTIPFVVVWDGNMGKMESAVRLMQRQRDAVAARISLVANRKDGFWFIKKQELEQVGHVTPGGDPELYYSWSLPRPESAKPDPERDKRNEFLDALYMTGVGKSRGELEYYWNQFCKHMLDWLLNKQKPVDLYFMTLHPTPYRANWEHILSGRYPKLWRAIGYKSQNQRELMLLESGFMDELLSLDLLAYNHKEDYCYRRIEIEYGKYWWSNVRAIEKERMSRMGVYHYARNVTDCVKRNLKCSLRVFGLYLAQISRPSVAHVDGESFGAFRFVPNIPKHKIRPRAPRVVDGPIVDAHKLTGFTPAGSTEEVFEEVTEMPAVPLVQPPAEDLRDSRHDVPEPRNRGTDEKGVHVLSPDEKLAAG